MSKVNTEAAIKSVRTIQRQLRAIARRVDLMSERINLVDDDIGSIFPSSGIDKARLYGSSCAIFESATSISGYCGQLASRLSSLEARLFSDSIGVVDCPDSEATVFKGPFGGNVVPFDRRQLHWT
ncbi:hypothetical protein [Tardiphaga sp.]|jgi:hypothetical protein|uniref:hypothetical protein n=1 Tax=Tardiphaga sp. TaxID=1926292 RepID=UPI0037D9E37A